MNFVCKFPGYLTPFLLQFVCGVHYVATCLKEVTFNKVTFFFYILVRALKEVRSLQTVQQIKLALCSVLAISYLGADHHF